MASRYEDLRDSKGLGTPAARLVELASSEHLLIRRHVASNPSAPLAALARLAEEFAQEVLDNPALQLLLLQDPALFARFTKGGVERLMALPWAIERLAGPLSAHPAAHLELARHPATTGDLLAQIAAQLSPPSFGVALFRITPPTELLWRALTSESWYLREPASLHPATPPAMLDLLRRAGASRDLKDIDGPRGALSPGELEQLAQGEAWGKRLAAAHPGAPLPLLARLATDKQYEVRAALLARSEVPEEIQFILAGDPTERVQRRLLEHKSRTRQATERLESSPFEGVVADLARGWPASGGQLERFAAHPGARVRAALACNPAIPAEVCLALLEDSAPEVAGAAASSAALPLEALARLGTHPLQQVRSGAAKNPRTPPDVLVELLRGGERKALANPSFPIERVGDDYTREQSVFVAQNPSLSREQCERLSTSEDPSTREKLASNEATPREILEALLEDEVDYVRKAAARNARCPRELVQRMIEREASLDVREAAEMALGRRRGR